MRFQRAILAATMAALAALPGGARAQAPAPGGSAAPLDPAREAMQLDAQRSILTDAGRYEELVPVLERLIELREKLWGADRVDTLQIVLWLAGVNRLAGAWDDSEERYRHVIDVLERTKQTGYVHYAIALGGLAALYADKGDYERAEPLARSLVAREEATDPRSIGLVKALVGLARLQQAAGAYGEAQAVLERALSLVLANMGPAVVQDTDVVSPSGVARSVPQPEVRTRVGETGILSALTLLMLDKGDLAAAEKYGSRAVEAQEEVGGPEAPGFAYALHDLGRVLIAKGDAEGASQRFARSLAIRQKGFGPDHPAVATILHSTARLRLAQGAAAEAEAFGRRALAIVEKAYGPDHRRVSDVLFDVADALVEQGRPAEALPFIDRATASRDRDAQVVLAVGSSAQKRALAAARRKQTDAAVSFAVLHAPLDPAAASLSLRSVLRAKGRLIDAAAGDLAAVRARLDDKGRALFADFERVTAAISASAALGDDTSTSPVAMARLDHLTAERLRLESAIADLSAAFRADESLVTVEDVARALPEGGALVEIAVFRPYLLPSAKERRPAATSIAWGEPHYAAFVLRDGAVSAHDLGPAAAVDASAERLRAALGDPDLSHDPRPAARDAFARILAPIAPRLAGATHLLVSPDGALALVPIGALMDPDGRYVAEERLVTYLASGRDLLRFAGGGPPRQAPLVVAAPEFGALSGVPAAAAARRSAEGVDMSRVGFLPLPDTAQEADIVERSLASGAVLKGALATESAVKAARAPAVLHIATHGFFLPAAPQDAPSMGLDVSGAETAAALRAESPLVRSGLALAGANLRASGAEDGILTALEASALDLAGTQLVVLSACETGLGAAVPGDGVYGLRRAFAIAGAETLVMSLWQVDSGRTRELMAGYYHRLSRGEGRSEALRGAQLAMLASKATAHPNVWSSFIVSGRWGPLAGTRAPAPPRVQPSPRACACATPGDDASNAPTSALAALGAMAVLITAGTVRVKRSRRDTGTPRRSTP